MSKNHNILSPVKSPKETLVLLLATAAFAACGSESKSTEKAPTASDGGAALVADETKATKPKGKPVSEENPGGFTDANDSNENLDADPEIHKQNVLQLLRNVPMRGESIPAMQDTTARELLEQTIEAFGPEQTLPGGVTVEDFGNALNEANLTLDPGDLKGLREESVDPDIEVPVGVSVSFSFDAAEANESK